MIQINEEQIDRLQPKTILNSVDGFHSCCRCYLCKKKLNLITERNTLLCITVVLCHLLHISSDMPPLGDSPVDDLSFGRNFPFLIYLSK